MNYCYFIVKGQCTLYGIHQKGYKDFLKIPVVRLNEGSWFGDYQMLLSIKSDWQLEASRPPKNSKGEREGQIQVLKIDDEAFRNICFDFPQFRKHMLSRSKIRRCHWK